MLARIGLGRSTTRRGGSSGNYEAIPLAPFDSPTPRRHTEDDDDEDADADGDVGGAGRTTAAAAAAAAGDTRPGWATAVDDPAGACGGHSRDTVQAL